MSPPHPLAPRFAYDAWANVEAFLSSRRIADPPARAGAILAHVVGSQRTWLGRLDPAAFAASALPVWPDLGPDETARHLDELAALWPEALDLPALREPDRRVEYADSRGGRHENSVGDILEHVLAHGPYHRGQVAALVASAGGVAAQTDLIVWARLGKPSPRPASSPATA